MLTASSAAGYPFGDCDKRRAVTHETRTYDSDKWIFSLKLRNSVGVLSSLTALFADRGVSIESLSAHGGGGGLSLGTAVMTFAATEARKAHLARLLGPPAVLDALLAQWSGGALGEQRAAVSVV